MIIKTHKQITEAEITDPKLFYNRRKIIKMLGAGAALASSMGPYSALASPTPNFSKLPKGPFSIDEEPTSYEHITSYNNFYEFGISKSAPAENAQNFKTKPWSVAIEGEVEKPGVYTLEDILKPHAMEQRIYRLRCVEAWSMVVPWVGFALGDLLKRFNPTSRAKFVELTTLYDPKQMPGQKLSVLKWPYVEGLRMDEAMHPLAILAVGIYNETLPNQNGAPIRLVVPWKYGFKSIKSIVKIRLSESMPKTSWNLSAPGEYGFYANVNPAVDHPRWSQKRERVIGASIFAPKRDTERFNGYAEEVGHLYAGMDLSRYF